MKKLFLVASLLVAFGIVNLSAQSLNNDWSSKKANKWFKKKEWLNGAPYKPHPSIDKAEFVKQYHLNQAYWDKAFAFLKNTDLKTLSVGRHNIDGDNVYATVQESPTKDLDKTAFESHRKYIDLQLVITGEENMGKAPLSAVTVSKPYDERTDLANYTGDGKIYTVPAGTFMLFFPKDAHRPNITPGGNKADKKIVIKIKVA